MLFFSVKAQQAPSAIVSSSAPANASTAYKEKWTAFHNPAILSSNKKLAIALNYDNRFQLKELSTKAISVSLPTKYVDVGLALSHFGYSQYNEMQTGLGLARSFYNKFSMGVQFNYYSVFLSPAEGYKGTVVAQLGLLSEISQGLFIGFHAYNPAQTNIKIGITEKRIPSIFSLGASFYFNEKLIGLAQFDKEIEYPLQWRSGFEYHLINELIIRLGGYGNPFIPALGASVIIKKFRLDANFEKHPILGINSFVGLSYTFK